MKLTIGMSCFNDFDGVWFTINSILMYHPEVRDDIRFVVIDGNPDSAHGKACEQLIAKLKNKHGHCGLYVKNISWSGTASRDLIFTYADTPYVLCVDSHVMLYPGCIKRLIDYYDENSDSKDLIQGPLYDENGDLFATEMTSVWDYNMYGKWLANPERIKTNKPYHVDIMGLGMFSCTRDRWPGFNPAFRGFGGEEGYIHEKYKQNGGQVIMFPWLKWNHRFPRPNGISYANEYIDRVKNYLIGWNELGKDTSDIIDYFSKGNTIPGQERSAFNRNMLHTLNTQTKILVQQQKDILLSPEELDVTTGLRSKIAQLEHSLELVNK